MWQLFTCHNLGSAGDWLEADYSTSCSLYRYKVYRPWTGAGALLYSIGVPVMFYVLVQKFQERGKKGDAVVQAAISWMYEPYRAGYEWWLPVETLRILLLTSTIGFLSESCYVKMLLAQIIAFSFFTLFLYVRIGCRRQHRRPRRP